MIRTVLIDDEPPARRKLRHLLEAESDVQIVGEAGSGGEAIELLNSAQPDIAYLDIQLPDCTGFDVIEALESRGTTHVVFVTAHDDFALKAFEVHAVDYLLKPVEPSRFSRSLDRVRRLLATPDPTRIASKLEELVRSIRPEQGYVRRLLIQENDRVLFVEVDRIEWIEAARNYVCIHAGDRTFIQRSSLESITAKLDPAIFKRLNRSEIVNVTRIAEVRSWFHGDGKVMLKSGKELSWSRRYRSAGLEDLERA